MLRKNHYCIDTLTLYHNLQSLEGSKQQFDLFNSNFRNLPFTRAGQQLFIGYLQRGEDVSKGSPKMSGKKEVVPQPVKPVHIGLSFDSTGNLSASNDPVSVGFLPSNYASENVKVVATPTDTAVHVLNADPPFSGMVGLIRFDGGPINVIMNNNYKCHNNNDK